jgi:hypothetical protein
MELDLDLPGLLVYYSLVLNVVDLNAEEIFLLEPKGGQHAWASLTVDSHWIMGFISIFQESQGPFLPLVSAAP